MFEMSSILSVMKNLALLVVLGWCSVLSWAQVDNEFWFVAPEVTSSHGDSPVLLRFATFDAPADVVVDMPANANYATYNLTIPANSALSIDLTDSLSGTKTSRSTRCLTRAFTSRARPTFRPTTR